MLRSVLALLVVTVSTAAAMAQSVNLTEKSTLGEKAQFAIELELKGNMILMLEKGKQPIALEAKASHRLIERVLAVTEGLPSTSARFYSEATASVKLASEKSERTLAKDRRLIVARRTSDGLSCFSLAGPLTREELDLVMDHFNPQCLPGLLPGKAVEVGDTWKLSEETVQAACLFDATIKASLSGTLAAVKGGVATFSIAGTAEGIENGAKVAVTVNASGLFDISSGHITGLTWKQKDDREQGPVNPASQIEATVSLKREAAAADVKELSDEALSAVIEDKALARFTNLRQADPKGRYRIHHAREWHVTGQTETHLIMRLLDRGEFIAQATVSVWSKADPGQHLPIEDFKKAVSSAPGWTPGKILVDRELPAPAGKWLYRLTMDGKMEDVPVIQTFYLLAGPQGEQIVVTVAVKPEKEKALAARDLNLVNSIEFGK